MNIGNLGNTSNSPTNLITLNPVDEIKNDIKNNIFNIQKHKKIIKLQKKEYAKEIFDSLKEEINDLKSFQKKFIGNNQITKIEKQIQYNYELMVFISDYFDLNLIEYKQKLDKLKKEQLIKKYKTSKYDVEKIDYLKRLFPIGSNKEISIKRSAGYFGGGISGTAESSNDTYLLSIDNFPNGTYSDYGILHEYLHIYLKELGLDLSLDSSDENKQKYFFYIKNLINDLLIEKIILDTFGTDYSFVSIDMRNSSIQQNTQRNIIVNMVKLTGLISNQLNFKHKPGLSEELGLYASKNKEIKNLINKLYQELNSIDIIKDIIKFGTMFDNFIKAVSNINKHIKYKNLQEIISKYMLEIVQKSIQGQYIYDTLIEQSKKLYDEIKIKENNTEEEEHIGQLTQIFENLDFPIDKQTYLKLFNEVDSFLSNSGLKETKKGEVCFSNQDKLTNFLKSNTSTSSTN